jgi:hypothetical protein
VNLARFSQLRRIAIAGKRRLPMFIAVAHESRRMFAIECPLNGGDPDESFHRLQRLP